MSTQKTGVLLLALLLVMGVAAPALAAEGVVLNTTPQGEMTVLLGANQGLVAIRYAIEGKVRTIKATHAHPFWAINKASYVQAQDLQAGDRLLLANGREAFVQQMIFPSASWRGPPEMVYNLEVQTAHNYYAAAGNEPDEQKAVLVHNANCPTDEFANILHIMEGEINPQGLATGFHYWGNGEHVVGKARKVNIPSVKDARGVYDSLVEVFNPATGQWVRKKVFSTFFPDHWSWVRTVEEMKGAFKIAEDVFYEGKKYFAGRSKSGVLIHFNKNGNGKIISAFPLYGK